jgi:hypothetical protein
MLTLDYYDVSRLFCPPQTNSLVQSLSSAVWLLNYNPDLELEDLCVTDTPVCSLVQPFQALLKKYRCLYRSEHCV